MSIFTEENKEQIKEIFDHLENKVRIEIFDQNEETDMVEFAQELCSLSDKLSCSYYGQESDRVKELGIERMPGLNLTAEDGKDLGVRFSGIPAGHEINSFISALLEIGGIGQELPEEFEERILQIEDPLKINVFVTMGCPHCPGAVIKAHKLAMLNPNIVAEMVEASTFPEFSAENNISVVPKIVFSNGLELVGDQPFDKILEAAEGKITD